MNELNILSDTHSKIPRLVYESLEYSIKRGQMIVTDELKV